MAFLSDKDKQKINRTIAAVETSTRGEIVTVLAKRCDHYLYIPTLWAALIALSVPGINFIFSETMNSTLTYQLQVLAFISLSWFFQMEWIKMKLIPKSIKYQRASLKAREQFFEQGLHTTEQRSGILIFVSEAEHYIEIIADKGINDKVQADAWLQVVKELSVKIRQGKTCDGFIQAIKQCQTPLTEHFPILEGKNTNELSNHLIEIDS